MIRFDVLTLFPEIFNVVLGESIIGRAQEDGLVNVNTINIRDFTLNKHKKVDDYPYGGGTGMVMTPQPIFDAFKSIEWIREKKPRTIYMSPQGKVLTQQKAIELSREDQLVILCGHYEGIDERVIEGLVDEELSIGDYVLTGGELPAMVLIDCICRMIPGVLANEDAYSNESIYNGMLEYPQYTRPYEFNNMFVPDILISGHHANIEKWRLMQSLIRTFLKRPDLFDKLNLSENEIKEIKNNIDKNN